jgi:hypothetical protein
MAAAENPPAELPRVAAEPPRPVVPPRVHQEMRDVPRGVQVGGDLNLLDETPPMLAVRSAEIVPQGDGSRRVLVHF